MPCSPVSAYNTRCSFKSLVHVRSVFVMIVFHERTGSISHTHTHKRRFLSKNLDVCWRSIGLRAARVVALVASTDWLPTIFRILPAICKIQQIMRLEVHTHFTPQTKFIQVVAAILKTNISNITAWPQINHEQNYYYPLPIVLPHAMVSHIFDCWAKYLSETYLRTKALRSFQPDIGK